jgi:hypothetical protein
MEDPMKDVQMGDVCPDLPCSQLLLGRDNKFSRSSDVIHKQKVYIERFIIFRSIERLNVSRTKYAGSMSNINLQRIFKKPFSEWTDEEKIFFLHDLLNNHKRPLPGYSETMLDNVIYSPDDRSAYRLSKK